MNERERVAEYTAGYRDGYLEGYRAGVDDGRQQGYSDAKWRAHRAVATRSKRTREAVRRIVGGYE